MDVKIKKSLENIPLAIFYIIVFIGLILFFDYAESPILISISSIVMTYFVLNSIYGKAIVTLTNDRIHLYSGLFSIGKRTSIPIKDLKAIYVKKTESGGEKTYAQTAHYVTLSIIFYTETKIKFLKNRIGKDGLMEYRNRIVKQIMKKYHADSLPNWNYEQHDFFHEYYEKN